jgi:hypothetical protein
LLLQSRLGRAAVLGAVTTTILAVGPFAHAATRSRGTTSSATTPNTPSTPNLPIPPVTPSTPSAPTGFDISWPQCGGPLPASSSVAIVGVDDGHQFSENPCLQQEAAWAASATTRGEYLVVDSPDGSTSANVLKYAYSGPAGTCTATEYECLGFNWAYNDTYYEVAYATSQGATSDNWWLDVELPDAGSMNPVGPDCYRPNFWSCDPNANSSVILGALAGLRAQGEQGGVYSTQSQWQTITGGLALGVPIWIAGWNAQAATYCNPVNSTDYWFAMGIPDLVQSLPATYDPDTACT